MADVVLLCSDGSDLSIAALAAGLAVVRADAVPLLATVATSLDTTLLHGTGFAGGLMSPEEFSEEEAAIQDAAVSSLAAVADRLGLSDAEQCVGWGDPGPALCQLADEREVAAIVIGSRGHGGIKRAVLGSVSDYVVRNATCPVVVVGPRGE